MLEQALKKLEDTKVAGAKAGVMAPAVAAVLRDFCRQDEEFAQAVVQGGSFRDCMTAVAKGVGNSISDLDAYKKAVQFFFPGAEIRMQLTIDLVGAAGGGEQAEAMEDPLRDNGKQGGIVLNLEDFL